MDGLMEMHAYSMDERFYKYFEFKPHKTVRDTEKYLKKVLRRVGKKVLGRSSMYWFVRRIKDSKLVGTMCLVEIDFDRQSTVWGYGIDPQYWGKGYILEMQEVLKKYVFEELHLNRLYGTTIIDNKAMISSALSAGFKEEGILRQYYCSHDGYYHDAWAYALLAEDYFNANKDNQKKERNIHLTLDELKKICASIFEILESNVNENTNMANVANWDSLNHIELILHIEDSIGFKFKPNEIAQATSVKSILEIVNGRKIKKVSKISG